MALQKVADAFSDELIYRDQNCFSMKQNTSLMGSTRFEKMLFQPWHCLR